MTEKERADVEEWIRAGIEYGWKVARLGLDRPDPLFDWSQGVPLIVADASMPSGGWTE